VANIGIGANERSCCSHPARPTISSTAEAPSLCFSPSSGKALQPRYIHPRELRVLRDSASGSIAYSRPASAPTSRSIARPTRRWSAEAMLQNVLIVGRPEMKRCLILLLLLGLATLVPLAEAFAQSSAGRGAVSGAIIGGAVGGRRGAAIGATAGAIAGANRSHRNWHNYYWRHGQCWYRSRSGRSHPVSHRYCR